MSVLICTPAYGGLLTTQYFQSMCATIYGLINDRIEFAFCTIDNESLISRGRNRCAAEALAGGYDRMFFIDADIGWTYADFKRVLDSRCDIIGGTYALKQLPLVPNVNPLFEHVGAKFERTFEGLEALRPHANAWGEVEVKHLPTGFMCIRTAALRALIAAEAVTPYETVSSTDWTVQKFHDFFPVRVQNGLYESEDWAFCSIAREWGLKVHLNLNVRLTHTGTFTYAPPAKHWLK